MIYDDAKELMTALEVNHTEGNFEIALEVLSKYGSYKQALQATIGIEFKKKEILLIALLGSEEAQDEDIHRAEAKRLINLVIAINNQLWIESQNMSIHFSELIDKIVLKEMISSRDLAILNAVRPYTNAKMLISEISCYQSGNIQLQVFIQAIKHTPSDVIQIANPLDRLQIKRG